MKIIQKLKMKLLLKWCNEFRLTPVRFVEIAGTSYIKHRDGSL